MIRSQSVRLALATSLLLAGFAGTANAAETLKLDLADARNQRAAVGAPETFAAESSVLAAGQGYVVTVSGTGSIWAPPSFTKSGTCGVSESRPMELTPGARNSLAAWDAATVFAAPIAASISPLGNPCAGLPLPLSTIPAVPGGPKPYAGFEMAIGASTERPVPVGGRRTVPRADHTYSWQVTGTGRTARFRFADTPSIDNSGVLTITVRTAEECAAISCLANAGTDGDDTPSLHPVEAATQSVGAIGERACNRAGTLRLRLTEPPGVDFKKATFYINGKKRIVAYRKTPRKNRQLVYATGRLKGKPRTLIIGKLPAGQIKLRVQVRTTRGQSLTVKRTIPACSTKKGARGLTFK